MIGSTHKKLIGQPSILLKNYIMLFNSLDFAVFLPIFFIL